MRFGDPHDDFARREREHEAWLKSRPICTCCKQHIQDERLMFVEGETYHIDCALIVFGEDTDDFT